MASWLVYAAAALISAYALVILGFIVAGRRESAKAVARFVPDCVVLFTRLLRGKRLPFRHKLLVARSFRTWPCRSI